MLKGADAGRSQNNISLFFKTLKIEHSGALAWNKEDNFFREIEVSLALGINGCFREENNRMAYNTISF